MVAAATTATMVKSFINISKIRELKLLGLLKKRDQLGQADCAVRSRKEVLKYARRQARRRKVAKENWE